MHCGYVLVHLLQQFIDLDCVNAVVWVQAVIAAVVPTMSRGGGELITSKSSTHPASNGTHLRQAKACARATCPQNTADPRAYTRGKAMPIRCEFILRPEISYSASEFYSIRAMIDEVVL